MILVSELKTGSDTSRAAILAACASRLSKRPEDIRLVKVAKRSVDARHKPDVSYVFSVWVEVPGEKALMRRADRLHLSQKEEPVYRFRAEGTKPLAHRPVIVGAGPCGLFAAWILAETGYAPLILERGKPVEDRLADVRTFWAGGALNPESNVQFGEGGAGTFSDGKLTSGIKDREGRIGKMLEVFASCGAPEEIRFMAKPHIGTDELRKVIVFMRHRLEEMGASFRFGARVTDIREKDGRLEALQINDHEWIPAEAAVLAIGHSARDTFAMLRGKGLEMERKLFAVGLRIEHPQTMIDVSQYGRERGEFPAADYKLTFRAPDGRGVYSFCMCPGGQVVNASSEPERLAVNGCSDHARAGRNANAAIVAAVLDGDLQAFAGEDPVFAGMALQRQLEAAAYAAAGGRVPVQLLADFESGVLSTAFGEVLPDTGGLTGFANLRQVLPEPFSQAILSAMPDFGRRIKGFDRPDAVFSGVETRTSSPVRIVRGEDMESTRIAGLYPCGEGAGYAGGITSAAIDGIKAAERIAMRFAPAAKEEER